MRNLFIAVTIVALFGSCVKETRTCRCTNKTTGEVVSIKYNDATKRQVKDNCLDYQITTQTGSELVNCELK